MVKKKLLKDLGFTKGMHGDYHTWWHPSMFWVHDKPEFHSTHSDQIGRYESQKAFLDKFLLHLRVRWVNEASQAVFDTLHKGDRDFADE